MIQKNAPSNLLVELDLIDEAITPASALRAAHPGEEDLVAEGALFAHDGKTLRIKDDDVIELEPIDEEDRPTPGGARRDEWPWLLDREDRIVPSDAASVMTIDDVGHRISTGAAGGEYPIRDGNGGDTSRRPAAETDHSATEDVILSQEPTPIGAVSGSGGGLTRAGQGSADRNGRRPMPSLPPRGEIARLATLAARTPPREASPPVQIPYLQSCEDCLIPQSPEPPACVAATVEPPAGQAQRALPAADGQSAFELHGATPPSEAVEQIDEIVSSGQSVSERSMVSGGTARSQPVAPSKPPRRIGTGRLVSERLTWRPGDPFADGVGATRPRFRWEVMLTVACGTALCGMAGIWLLRTVLAP